jgi:hypothetical protein
MLTDQLPGRFVRENIPDWNFEISLTGPKVGGRKNPARRELNIHERIDLLQTHLRLSGDLRDGRPQSIEDLGWPKGPRFVMENTDAVKLIVPPPALAVVKGLTSLGLWVSNPDFAPFTDDWSFRGSFLYLIEAHWDDLPFNTTFTGCSALQAVVNGVSGLHLAPRSSIQPSWREPLLTPDYQEPFGRGSMDHPIEKLQRIGATVSDRRRISTLYRLRYMTNEQCFSRGSAHDRFHDILGYPLYISDI